MSRSVLSRLNPHAISIGTAALAFTIYAVFATYHSNLHWGDLSIFHLSEYPYFNYLADSFLHGQLYLRELPEKTHDLVLANGHYFLYWPPFPAVVLAPFVAVFGIAFSDIFLTLIIGTLNVWLTAKFFARLRSIGVIESSDEHLLMLVVCFAFGTVHLTMAPLGRVWFDRPTLGLSFRSPGLFGRRFPRGTQSVSGDRIAFSAAVATRNHLIFLGLWPAYYLL